MTDKAALLFATVSAINAEIDGMKAENDHCQNTGRGIVYGEESFFPLVDKINAAIAEFQEPALREKINIEINGVSLGPCEIKPGPSLVVPGKPLVGKCEDCGVEIRKGTFFSCDLVGRLLCKKCFDIENARPEAPKA